MITVEAQQAPLPQTQQTQVIQGALVPVLALLQLQVQDPNVPGCCWHHLPGS